MKIALSVINFLPGKMGGVETYLRNLVHYLQLLDRENDYLLLCDKRCAGDFPITNPHMQVRSYNSARPSAGWFWRGVGRNLLKVDMLEMAINRLKVDVVHHPFSMLSPMGVKAPSVLTFWDMQHEFYPDFFTEAELRERRAKYPASVEQATRIIVSATFTKECLVERYGVHPDKIDVVYTGYGPEYRPIDDGAALQSIRDKYQLDRPFIYYPAATWPHKNHKALLAAFRLLREEPGFDGDLVLTGIAMQKKDALVREMERLGVADGVRLLGYLPYAELPYLYNLAKVLAFPSLFEGFGIPVVEAMACGCPVVCSDATSLPEVVGDAGLTFGPNSPEDIAEKIWSVWKDDALRQEMRARGLERVKLFDWETTARRTMDVYAKAASR